MKFISYFLNFIFSSYLFIIFFLLTICLLFFLFYFKMVLIDDNTILLYKQRLCKKQNNFRLQDNCFLYYHLFYLTILLYLFLFIYLYTLYIFYKFNIEILTFQMIFYLDFFNYHVYFGLDSLGLIFLLLTSLIFPLCITIHYFGYLKDIYNFKNINYFPKLLKQKIRKSFYYLVSLIFLYLLLIIFFSTLDLFIFFLVFEGSVIPLFIIILLFGSHTINKVKAAYYLFFFTVLSSISFFIAILFILFTNGSTNLLLLTFNTYTEDIQCYLWLSLFIPLASKIPIIPFHIWLPEAHVEAPTEGSVILASLMLKLGAYFIIRLLFTLFPVGFQYFSTITYSLCIISLLYTSFLIFIQIDLKKIIAYSSISHMNLALLGLFSGTIEGIHGSIYMFFSHGIISSGLFICIGWLYNRYYTRILINYSGLTIYYPLFSFFFFIFILGNLSFPGTGSFVAELLIIIGILKKNIFLATLCIFASLLCTAYSIILYTRIFFGIPLAFSKVNFFNLAKNRTLYNEVFRRRIKRINTYLNQNISISEFFILTYLTVYTLILGIQPLIYINFINNFVLYLFISITL